MSADELEVGPPPFIRVIDLETTGLDDDAAACEVGFTDVRLYGGGEWEIGAPQSFLIDPRRPIPPEVSAIHHIRDRDVQGQRTADSVFLELHDPRITHYAAHNAAFDRRFFTGGSRPWICTLKAAYRAFPRATAHGNQALRYMLEFDDYMGFMPAQAMPPHRAGPDTYVTAHLLCFLLNNGYTLERMASITESPSVLPRVTFGKHKGALWSEVPTDYLEWLRGEKHDDPDVRHTVKHWIDKRRGG